MGLALLAMACRGTPGHLSEPGAPLAPCDRTVACVSTETSDSLYVMPPVPWGGQRREAQAIARAAILAEPRLRITKDVPGYLRAEASSRIFHFVDDVEVVVDSTTMLFRFRSASRSGRRDRGAVRQRMERISDRLRVGVGVSVPLDSAGH